MKSLRDKFDVAVAALRSIAANPEGSEETRQHSFARKALVDIGEEVFVVEIVHLRRTGAPPKNRAKRIELAVDEDRGWTRTECGKRIRSGEDGWIWEVQYVQAGERACTKCVGARRRREA